MKFSILNLENVYYLTRGFIASTRALNLLTRAFNLPTRAFNTPTRAFNHATRAVTLRSRINGPSRLFFFKKKSDPPPSPRCYKDPSPLPTPFFIRVT